MSQVLSENFRPGIGGFDRGDDICFLIGKSGEDGIILRGLNVRLTLTDAGDGWDGSVGDVDVFQQSQGYQKERGKNGKFFDDFEHESSLSCHSLTASVKFFCEIESYIIAGMSCGILRILKRLYTYRSSFHFIYVDQYRYFGSTVMRGQQLSQIAKKALPRTNKVYFTSADYTYKHCTLFLTKWAIFTISLKDLQRLKENGNLLVFDPVDAILPPERLKYADVVIAASKTIYKDYKKIFPPSMKVAVVDHNVDLRLTHLT